MTRKSVQVVEHPEAPRFVLRKTAVKGYWEIGEEGNTIKLEHFGAMDDLRYLVLNPWEQVSAADLPGTSISTTDLQQRDSLPVNPEGWTGFGSDDVSNTRTITECRSELIRLKDELEIAKLTGDYSEASKNEELIEKYVRYLNESTRSGGRLRRLTVADPVARAADAARKRKDRLVERLKERGSVFMGEHIQQAYKVRQRIAFYGPIYPEPIWILS